MTEDKIEALVANYEHWNPKIKIRSLLLMAASYEEEWMTGSAFGKKLGRSIDVIRVLANIGVVESRRSTGGGRYRLMPEVRCWAETQPGFDAIKAATLVAHNQK